MSSRPTPIIVESSEDTRPRFIAILEKMIKTGQPALLRSDRDCMSLYQNARRRALGLWKRRTGPSEWIMKVQLPSEKEDPLDAYGAPYQQRLEYGQWKTIVADLERDGEIIVQDMETAKRLRIHCRRYLPREHSEVTIEPVHSKFRVKMVNPRRSRKSATSKAKPKKKAKKRPKKAKGVASNAPLNAKPRKQGASRSVRSALV